LKDKCSHESKEVVEELKNWMCQSISKAKCCGVSHFVLATCIIQNLSCCKRRIMENSNISPMQKLYNLHPPKKKKKNTQVSTQAKKYHLSKILI
jgi:hypothetical protein